MRWFRIRHATWLKAIAFTIINRRKISSLDDDHPLQTSNPHDVVPFVEYNHYGNNQVNSDISQMTLPRLLATHMPYSGLPTSVANSGCRIVYICHNPFDTFIWVWHDIMKPRPQELWSVYVWRSVWHVLQQGCYWLWSVLGPYVGVYLCYNHIMLSTYDIALIFIFK